MDAPIGTAQILNKYGKNMKYRQSNAREGNAFRKLKADSRIPPSFEHNAGKTREIDKQRSVNKMQKNMKLRKQV